MAWGNMTQVLEAKADTFFNGWCSDLEGCVFDLGPRPSNKFSRTMKEPERYFGETYRNICQPEIMTKTPEAFPDQEIRPL